MSNQMQIEVVNVNVSTQPTAKGSYQIADVAYKNKSFQDKLEGKKVMSFANKDVFDILTKAQFGDVFTISRVKNDKGYWDWTSVDRDGGGAVANQPVAAAPNAGAAVAAPRVATPAPKSNYETAEERAARQVLIVRQSSVSSAVELAVAAKIKDPQEVIKMARQFEDYVFDRNTEHEEARPEVPEPPAGFFDDMDNDLPA